MCVQCAMGAMAAGAAATGARAWLAARRPAWLTPRRQRVLTAALVAGGVLGAGTISGF